MEVQEYVNILIFDPEELEDTSGPIELVFDDCPEEGLDALDRILSALVENLGNVDVFCLVPGCDILPCRK